MNWLTSASRTKRAAIGGFIGLCVAGGMLAAQATRGSGVERELARMATEIQKQLPLQVDEVTTWVSAMADGDTLTYRYNIDGPAAEFGSVEVLRPGVTAALCSDPGMTEGLERGARFAYLYEGSDGGIIGTFTVEAGACAA